MVIKHLGVIPDGNRRWARAHGITNREAYDYFTCHICDVITEANSFDLEMISFYVVSKENLQRKEQDVEDVLDAVCCMFNEKMPGLIDKLQLRMRCIGIESITNKKLLDAAKRIEDYSRNNSGMVVNLLIGYNPIDEINLAIAGNKELKIENLLVPQCVDLLIRTAGGPVRISNFLPLQCGYASIVVFKEKFLDVSCEAITNTIKKYQSIEPKYGR